jgi:flotillin
VLLLLEIDVGLTLVMSLVVGVLWWGIQTFLERHIYICGPNEVLVFSGRSHNDLGYRVVKGGRSTRVPVLETCQRLSLLPLSVQRKQSFALADSGEKVALKIDAEVKITAAEPGLTHAIHRFLGCESDEIADTAANTLVNVLGTYLATCDAKSLPLGETFPVELSDPLEADLLKIGLELKSLRLSAE